MYARKDKHDHFAFISTSQAYCDMETDEDGWTVFQCRMDGSIEFFLNYAHYVQGFGNTSGEYWLGLSKIHRLANSSTPEELSVNFEDFSGNTAYAKHDFFYIGRYSTDYTIYGRGNPGTAGVSLAYHHGSKFTTKDNDNDVDGGNCAITYQGAW